MKLSDALLVGLTDEEWQIYFRKSKLTAEEACLNRCEDCGVIIQRYPDARWRFTELAPCRCRTCAETAMRMGESSFDAYMVS